MSTDKPVIHYQSVEQLAEDFGVGWGLDPERAAFICERIRLSKRPAVLLTSTPKPEEPKP